MNPIGNDIGHLELVNMAHQLVCLRNVANLLSNNSMPTDEILTTFVHLITEAWQYPEITCVRIIIGQDTITSTNFAVTKWILKSPIMIAKREIGKLEVFYLQERPNEYDGPFLQGECYIIETLAIELQHFIERRELLKSKEQQHRELSLYTSLLRHDFKNDLGVILANIDLARMLNHNFDDDMKEILNSTEFVCNRMMNVLTALSRSHKEADQNLIEIINKVVQSAQKIHTGITINLVNKLKLESVIIPVSNLLPLVFENLIRNAAVHAGENCIVTIQITKLNGQVAVRISDNGKGIEDSVRGKLFQKGVSTRGEGLGLYLSKQVVETIGGTIELASSEAGEGAVFVVRLPLVIITNGGSQK
ncbi:MAG: sensor histidine kinase [Candidatus Thorarchaeota archaeon]